MDALRRRVFDLRKQHPAGDNQTGQDADGGNPAQQQPRPR